MTRLLTLWLTLLAAFWLTRTAVSAVLFQRVDQGLGAWAELLIVPLLQAAVVGWLTRSPPARVPASAPDDIPDEENGED
ncbi:MAG TPA: hypothetical protein VKK31_13965 [Thermoanaerobaculia bacterium]|nr:hypothetical protein [Thermoanaerobaculia bacterium]